MIVVRTPELSKVSMDVLLEYIVVPEIRVSSAEMRLINEVYAIVSTLFVKIFDKLV